MVTIPPKVAEAARVSGYVDFSQDPEFADIPIRQLQSYSFEPPDVDFVHEISPDILLVNGWNRIIPEEVFTVPKFGGFGVHAGHPPRGRGRAPLAWTLINGLEDLEVYLFGLQAEADAGPIYGFQRVEITPQEDARTLYDKVALAIADLYTDNLGDILDQSAVPLEQDDALATYLPKRTPEDGEIDWAWDCRRLHNFIRGQSDPYPGAFTTVKGRALTVWAAQPYGKLHGFGIEPPPGEILGVVPSGWIVRTGTSPLLIRKLAWRETNIPLDQSEMELPRGTRLGT